MDKRKEILQFFQELRFEDTSHTYEVRGFPLTSVSNMIKGFVEKVDFNMIAGFIARKEGVTKAEVLDRWETKKNNACSLGHSVHLFGETFMETGAEPTNGFEEAIVAFWKSLPSYLVPFIFELKMFSKELGLAGTTDIILYNTLTGNFIIADYKTNESLVKNFKEKTLLPPFDNLLDCPLSKYEIQLSAYQILFEQTGYKVEDRMVIWLRPYGNFEIIKTRDLTNILKETL